MANKTVFLKNNYELDVVSFYDVIESVSFNNDFDKIITKEIIKQLETKAGNTIRDNKTVLIPYVGSLRKSAVRQEFKKNFKLLKTAGKLMNKEDYKEYAKDTYRECMDKVNKVETQKILKNKLISANRKRYNEIYKNLGELFANTWVYSLLLVHVIEFNQEVEDAFHDLK